MEELSSRLGRSQLEISIPGGGSDVVSTQAYW